jgi:hypothetical protein
MRAGSCRFTTSAAQTANNEGRDEMKHSVKVIGTGGKVITIRTMDNPTNYMVRNVADGKFYKTA